MKNSIRDISNEIPIPISIPKPQLNSNLLGNSFEIIRNSFNFTFVCEFLNKFSSAFFNGPDDILPTTPVSFIWVFIKSF